MESIKPPRLKRGDLIALVSPASTPTPAEKIEHSVRYLEARGYRVEVGRYAAAEHGYLAGTDAQRANDFNAAIRDPRVKAIFALRGGYGTPRILPVIDYASLRRQPKIISGFSDITALQLAIYRKMRLVTFSGPMPAVEFWKDPDPWTEEHFWRLLTSVRPVGQLKNPPGHPVQRRSGPGGEAVRGPIVGGNLALVCSTLGTPFFPNLRGAILALEEVDEYPYRVDRLFAQLRNARVFQKIAGLLLGQFTRCTPSDPAKPSLETEQILQEYTETIRVPVLSNLQYGHIPKKLTLPFGLEVQMNERSMTVQIPQAAVR